MERRDFLKKAGAGTAALAALPFLTEVVHADNDPDGGMKFDFVALSGVTPTLAGGDSIAMSGRGRFDGGRVEGGGEFVHFDGTQIPSTEFMATGRWEATGLVSFTEVGAWGRFVAGILTVGATLRPCHGAPPITGATLQIVCNLGPAGISTGGVEGYTLTLPDGTTFSAFSPNIGLTLFTRRCEEVE